jgi:dolichol-phosphate mannosyltransferase
LQQSISFILPALNEGNSIEQVIHKIPRKELEHRGYGVSVWVLDGKSKDKTVAIARKNGAKIYLQTGSGKGNAVSEVFSFLKSDYVVMLDADNTYDPRDILPMMPLLENGHHIVMGSRMRGDMTPGAMSSKNRLGNQMLSRAAGILYGKRVSDLCTGFWGFKGSVISKLGIDAQGFELEAQLFSRASKLGLTIGEVPIRYGTRCGDETKLSGMSSGARIFWTLVRERVLHGNGSAHAMEATTDPQGHPHTCRDPHPLAEE